MSPRRPVCFFNLGHTIHYTLLDSTFIRVFGYEESTGTIFEVRGIVVLRFSRQLMMTLPKFGQNCIFLILKYSFFYIYFYAQFSHIHFIYIYYVKVF